jgi:recombination protein RecA
LPPDQQREDARAKKRREKAEKATKTKRAVDAAVVSKLIKDGKLSLGNDPKFVLEWISTGIPQFDKILGGGMPRKRITILFGEYSSAKTFLVQMLMKSAIAQGLKVAYIDTERSYDPTWWAQVGIPLDKILVSQPTHGEAAVDVTVALAKANVDVVAIDSLAALIPKEEADDDATAEKKNVASQARLISKMMRMLVTVDTNSCLVMTNQVRDTIGGPAPGVQMPGGKALKHFSSIIVRLRREDWIKEKEVRVGFQLIAQAAKSKVAQPFGECRLPFRFRGVIDLISLLVDRGLEAGLIEQSGPWFNLVMDDVDEPQALGRNKMIELLQEDDKLRKRLEDALG